MSDAGKVIWPHRQSNLLQDPEGSPPDLEDSETAPGVLRPDRNSGWLGRHLRASYVTFLGLEAGFRHLPMTTGVGGGGVRWGAVAFIDFYAK